MWAFVSVVAILIYLFSFVKYYFNNFFIDIKKVLIYHGAMINTELIEARRKKLKISKYRMADKLEMSRQTYYSILNNKSTTLNTLDKIASILGLKSKDLVI